VIPTEAVWREFRQPLLSFISRRVPNAAEADDVLQDVFLKVHRHLSEVNDETRLASWLYQVARNTLIDRHRRTRAMEELPESLPLAEDEAEVLAAERHIAGCLKATIEELPAPYRDALLLSELEGLPQRVVAERLGLSLSGAKSRVQRGRRMVRDTLLACCHFEFDQRGRIMEYVPRATCCADP
jgi:RNA polymerase sigma-70 factor, ECF subfamily